MILDTVETLCDCCDNPIKEGHEYVGYDDVFPCHVCLKCARKYTWNTLIGPSGRIILSFEETPRRWKGG